VETERAWRSTRVAYLVVLIGAAAYVASCFLPYYEIGLGGRNETVTMYEQLQVGSDHWTLDLGNLLLLFGSVAVLAAIAIAGLAGRGHPLVLPAMLAVVALAWFLPSFGILLRVSALRQSPLSGGLWLEVGFWIQALSVLVVVLGTVALLVAARRAATRERQPSAGP
jgi:hypothetical protein